MNLVNVKWIGGFFPEVTEPGVGCVVDFILFIKRMVDWLP